MPGFWSCLAGCLIISLQGPAGLYAQESATVSLIHRYAYTDSMGRNTGSLEIRLIRKNGGLEIVSMDSAGLGGYARLGSGMIQEEVRVQSASGKVLAFSLLPSKDSWEIQGAAKKSCIRNGDSWLGDRSLFFILPALVNLNTIGFEKIFILIRPESAQRAAMRLRVEGIVDALDVSGRPERAYHITMVLADPVGRMIWPYAYNYYYRVGDVSFLAYDGPDENRMNSRIVFLDAREMTN